MMLKFKLSQAFVKLSYLVTFQRDALETQSRRPLAVYLQLEDVSLRRWRSSIYSSS